LEINPRIGANLKAAKTLGLEVLPTLLGRTDQAE
jgi:hypothetical protein